MEKAELYNSLFSKRSPRKNNARTLLTYIQYLMNNRLSSVTFSQDAIAKIIQNLDPGKTYRYDNSSIRMLKNCGPAILKPLAIILDNVLI